MVNQLQKPNISIMRAMTFARIFLTFIHHAMLSLMMGIITAGLIMAFAEPLTAVASAFLAFTLVSSFLGAISLAYAAGSIFLENTRSHTVEPKNKKSELSSNKDAFFSHASHPEVRSEPEICVALS